MIDPDDTQRLRLLKRDGEPSRPKLPSVHELSDDPHEALGQVMGATARVGERVELLAREVNGLRRDVELDRRALVRGASRSASRHSSNRTAALMGTLFILYEQAAPVLRAVWRGLHS
jgi:hypothetical protein